MGRWSPKALWRAAIAAALAAAALVYLLQGGSASPKYVTAPVTRGAIVRAVNASGSVNPVVTVQVGSYVSGPIQAIYADYNAAVKQRQLIAKIDPRPFEVKAAQSRAALANAKAQLLKSQADLEYKKLAYERNRAMVREGAVSQDIADSMRNAYKQAVAQVALDEANIQQQQAMLREAEVNLGYTNIVSPVDGTVVSRNVDVGQTVAASFQTPTLFLIAKDLTQMEVDTNVSESDIGAVQAGQPATFTVDAFPNREFEGSVQQVRQAPITVQNVVTYNVVVDVANPELLLKPGMTANLTIVTARRDNAVRVPLQALRFHPSARDHAATDGSGSIDQRQARVWTLDGRKLKRVAITTGLDDSNNVELLKGDLHPGEEVVTDEIKPVKSTNASPPGIMSPPRMRGMR